MKPTNSTSKLINVIFKIKRNTTPQSPHSNNLLKTATFETDFAHNALVATSFPRLMKAQTIFNATNL